MSGRRRLDLELVERELVGSRSEASELIAAGQVAVNGSVDAKPARKVAAADRLELLGQANPYVGRGAHKLAHALDTFRIDPAGRTVVDAGASTGGFTDVVLQRGAIKVFAIDVGHAQLHERLRNDHRVVNLERTNVRDLTPATTGEPVDLIVADLSFISLGLVIRPLIDVAAPDADLVLLVKPQFEAGRREVKRGGGVIRDHAVHARVRAAIDTALADEDCTVCAWTESPIRGGDGNREWLVHARAPGPTI